MPSWGTDDNVEGQLRAVRARETRSGSFWGEYGGKEEKVKKVAEESLKKYRNEVRAEGGEISKLVEVLEGGVGGEVS